MIYEHLNWLLAPRPYIWCSCSIFCDFFINDNVNSI